MVRALAYCTWAASVGILLLAILALARMLDLTGRLDAFGLPLVCLLSMILAVLVLARWPSRVTALGFLGVGTAATAVYQVALLTAWPQLQTEGLYLLNRPALALVLVGTVSGSALGAVGWGVLGFLAGAGVTVSVAVSFGLPPLLGGGPALTLISYAAAFTGVALIQRAGRHRMPDLALLREQTRRTELERVVDRRSAALIHDTILNDLALVAHAAPTLDARTRDRLRRDIHRVAQPVTADWPGPRPHLTAPDGSRAADDGPEELGSVPPRFTDAVMALAEDFQWRGLTVDVVVDSNTTIAPPPDSAAAALGALGAALENVLRHSGVDSAEIIVGADADRISLMLVDAGTGFDTSAVPADRLGLHASVRARIEAVGGTVNLWSTPGSGTSVLMSIPQRAGRADGAVHA
jgi:signal transduction histidine kinase